MIGQGGIYVEVHRENLDSEFTVVPNALLRGQGHYAALSPLARIMLAAGLSCQNGWRATLEEIERWVSPPGAPIGRDRREAVRRELREAGFLTMRQGRVSAGQPNGGEFMWSFGFFIRPLPAEARDQLQARGQAQGISAGRTMPGSPGHGASGHGHPGPDEPGVAPYIEKNQERKEPPPPRPVDNVPAQRGAGVSEEEAEALLRQAEDTMRAVYRRVRVPAGKQPTGNRHRDLKQLAAARIAAGWHPEALADQLADSLPAVSVPFAILKARLRDLGDPPVAEPARSFRPQWCGECDERTRQRVNDEGVPYRCPACHPMVRSAA